MTTLEQKARDLLGRIGVPNPHDYTAGELVELANLMAAAPAWEPLTPERMAAIIAGGRQDQMWVAVPALKVARPMYWEPVLNCFYDDSCALKVWPNEVTHIMPFVTPSMPGE